MSTQKMIDSIFSHPLVIGAGGITAVDAVHAIPTPQDVATIGNLIIQAIIGFVAVWAAIKKARNNKKNKSDE